LGRWEGSVTKPGKDIILIRHARVHNLKNITVEIPKGEMVVISGVSGSGKSSLAFDTLFAEGQRRFVESLSAYARQFLERMDRPDLDEITGICPAIAVGRREKSPSPRSTVGTSTEIYDYLRLLFSRVGKVHCISCGYLITADTIDSAVSTIQALEPGTRVVLGFPLARPESGDWNGEIERLGGLGFARVIIGKRILPVDSAAGRLRSNRKELKVVVDRITTGRTGTSRIAEAIETAYEMSGGRAFAFTPGDGKTTKFIGLLRCRNCGEDAPKLQPALFSFNNPLGACPGCRGFGDRIEYDIDLIIPDKSKTLRQGAVEPWNRPSRRRWKRRLIQWGEETGFPIDVPVSKLSQSEMETLMNGGPGFRGILGFFRKLERKKYKIGIRVLLSRYRSYVTCGECAGTRLRPEALSVTVGGKDIAEILSMPVGDSFQFLSKVRLSKKDRIVGDEILADILRRLAYLNEVGLHYITLDRPMRTLSGGEEQRVNLASTIGSGLVDTLYVLDEPSVGLHPRDICRLTSILRGIRDTGNSVVVVEHDRSIIESADHLIELGPGAGRFGGEIVFEGTPTELMGSHTLTAEYLSGKKAVAAFGSSKPVGDRYLVLKGAREHNLKDIELELPLGVWTCVTGVSGSGKSTLVVDCLYKSMALRLKKSSEKPGSCNELSGADEIDDVLLVDQEPIGKTPRSNPASYVKALDPIRKLFASTSQASRMHMDPGHFSFNLEKGRCPKCEGNGILTIDLQFLADAVVTCDLCHGTRYKDRVLSVRYMGKNIAQVLEMTVEEAFDFFEEESAVRARLQPLIDVGLGYLTLGQSATTLSGGEAQRLKLARELGPRRSQSILYILDEPTTGLHFDDLAKLIKCLRTLVEMGHTVLVVEHNMDFVKSCDYVIDLGPGGGDDGGRIVGRGTPEELSRNKKSITSTYLARALARG
jgi:excinuclease ABC subunit A